MSSVEPKTGTSASAARLARSDTAGLLYGAIVTAAVLVTVGGHDDSVGHVVTAWAIVLGTYWLTHVYVVTWEAQFHGDTRRLGARLATAARTESTVLVGGLPTMAVFLLASLFGLDVFEAERIALYTTVILLTLVGFVGARHAGHPLRVAMSEAAGAGLLGVIMVGAKTLLH